MNKEEAKKPTVPLSERIGFGLLLYMTVSGMSMMSFLLGNTPIAWFFFLAMQICGIALFIQVIRGKQ